MARTADFNNSVPLPPGLTIPAIRKSIEYIEKELSQLIDIYQEQANVSGATLLTPPNPSRRGSLSSYGA